LVFSKEVFCLVRIDGFNDATYLVDIFVKKTGRGDGAKNAVELVTGSIRRAQFAAS
jgi:hypothetical protein